MREEGNAHLEPGVADLGGSRGRRPQVSEVSAVSLSPDCAVSPQPIAAATPCLLLAGAAAAHRLR